MNVAFVTGSEKKCGIHHYADIVCEILSKSTKHNFYLLECDSEEEFHAKCNADIVIMNYQPITLGWYTPEASARISQIQFLIEDHGQISDMIYQRMPNVKEVISMDVTRADELHFHPGVRPVLEYNDITYFPPKDKLRIGTSGIGQPIKHIEHMISLINQQFSEPVDFCIHFSVGAFTGYNEEHFTPFIEHCKKITAPNVNIQFVCQTFTDKELIEWLNQNDINIFIYQMYNSNAVSASIDNALAARKPIGVNNSNFFKHIYSKEIALEQSPIKDIIARGVKPLEKFYEMWNPQKLLEQYEMLVDRYE